MAKWDNVSEKLSQKSEQVLENSIQTAQVEHQLNMSKLYQRAARLDVSTINDGKKILEQLNI